MWSCQYNKTFNPQVKLLNNNNSYSISRSHRCNKWWTLNNKWCSHRCKGSPLNHSSFNSSRRLDWTRWHSGISLASHQMRAMPLCQKRRKKIYSDQWWNRTEWRSPARNNSESRPPTPSGSKKCRSTKPTINSKNIKGNSRFSVDSQAWKRHFNFQYQTPRRPRGKTTWFTWCAGVTKMDHF